MDNTTKLFNPFSFSLATNERNDFTPPSWKVVETVYNEPIYVDGDYSIYKKSSEHFQHCYKHVIFAERVGANKELITDMINDSFSGNGNQYINFDRPKQAIKDGLEWSKRYIEFN